MTSLREATFEDHRGIMALVARNGLESKDFEIWKSLWQGNPAFDTTAAWPIGWVLETSASGGSMIVGFLGNLPTTYLLNGRKLKAAVAFTWAVDAAYRSSSITLLARFFAQSGIDLFITTTVRRESGAIFPAFKAKKIPVPGYDEASFVITDPKAFAKSLVTKAGLPRFFSIPAALAIQLVDLSRQRRWRHEKDIHVKFLDTFDDRFDLFWEALQKEKASKLLAVRDQKTLKWHYQQSLSSGRAWLLTHEQEGKLNGYAVLVREDNPSLKLTRMRLADFQVLEGHSEWLEPLLGAAVEKCFEQGISMLEIIGFQYLKSGVLSGLHRRDLDAWPFYYKASGKELGAELAKEQVWAPCLYDGDGSI